MLCLLSTYGAKGPLDLRWGSGWRSGRSGGLWEVGGNPEPFFFKKTSWVKSSSENLLMHAYMGGWVVRTPAPCAGGTDPLTPPFLSSEF